MLDGLCDLMGVWITVLLIWRITCLFRKRGACRFSGCLFRKDYTNTSFMNTFSCGCTKCPPTEEEWAVYERTPDGILDCLKHKDKIC